MIHLFLLLWLSGQAPSSEALEHLRAGVAADKQHQFDIAIVEFRKATELDPNLAEGFVSLGQAYMRAAGLGSAWMIQAIAAGPWKSFSRLRVPQFCKRRWILSNPQCRPR